MATVIFFLVPVVLLVVLIILLLSVQNHNRKTPLYFVEPLGWLLKSWHVARITHNPEAAYQLLELIQGARIAERSLLDELVKETSFKHQAPIAAELLEAQVIGPMARRYIFQEGRKMRSIVFGPPSQIKGWIDEVTREKAAIACQQAATQGFLGLMLAERQLHSAKGSQAVAEHGVVAVVLLEAVMDNQHRELMRVYAERIKILSALPEAYASEVLEATTGRVELAVNAGQALSLHPPHFAEEELRKARVIGSADLPQRYSIIRNSQHHFDCRIISTAPEDRQLPITPQSSFS